jgi:two-component system heavy metal sensor histidine kinase CusS
MQQHGRIIDPKTLPHTLVVARDAKLVHRVLTRLRWILATGTLLTLSLGFTLIHRAVRVSLRPIDLLTNQVRDRASHQLDSALEVPDELPAELAGLAENFDSLLARVAAIRQRERDFIRHAAHELRTPIAAMQATTELALSRTRDAAAYVAHLATCRKVAVELGALVQRLTELARIGHAPSSARLEAIDLENLMDDCLQHFLPVFQQRNLELSRTAAAALPPAWGDPTLVRIIFNNLLDNAASHATSGGAIAIRCRHSGGRVAVSVANTAEDLPEDLDRLFEPHFRQGTSNNQLKAHLGIGLALSLEAATAMGAKLLANRPDAGKIEFVFTLDAAPS